MLAANNPAHTPAEVDAAISFLPEAIHSIQLAGDFSDIVPQEYRDGLNSQALTLSAAIANYLIAAIRHFTTKNRRDKSLTS